MPQHKQAKKRVRQAEKRRVANHSKKAKMRTLVKRVFDEEDKEAAQAKLKDAVSILDRVATKGLIHQNKAAREKSKLTNYVNNL